MSKYGNMIMAAILAFAFGFSPALYAADLPLGLQHEGLLHTLTATLQGKIKGYEGTHISVAAPYRTECHENELDCPVQKEGREFDVRYLFANSSEQADHLVFIIPGFGSTNDAGAATYLMALLSQSGFSSAVVDSPASKRFMTNSHRWGFSGVMRLDAEDLYEGMLVSMTELEAIRGRPFKKVSLVGASLGGMNTALVLIESNKARNKNTLKFHRAISLNPPISNVYGLKLIDEMMTESKHEDHEETVTALVHAFKNLYLVGEVTMENLAERAAKIVTEAKISLEEARFLIGYNFSSTVNGGWLASDERLSDTDISRVMALCRSDYTTFYEYFACVSGPIWRELRCGSCASDRLMPSFNIDNPVFLDGVELTGFNDKFIQSESIRENGEKLQVPNFVLVSWYDDFLIGPNDPEWVLNTFDGTAEDHPRGRSRFFDKGGHLGGYYDPEFQKYILDILKED